MVPTTLEAALDHELGAYRAARRRCDFGVAWTALERAHILSQADLGRHLRVHALMLELAARTADARELWGQLARLALAPLGTLTGRTPWGNSGRSNVSAFRAMPIPADLRELMSDPRGV